MWALGLIPSLFWSCLPIYKSLTNFSMVIDEARPQVKLPHNWCHSPCCSWYVSAAEDGGLGVRMVSCGVPHSPHFLSAYYVTGTVLVVCVLSCFSSVWLFATLWTIASQAPLSMGFPRQEYWSGLPFATPGDLPNPGTQPPSHVFCTGRLVLYH